METLFRLALTRPPITQDEGRPSIRLAQDSPFQGDLGEAQQSQNPRDALKAVARQFVASPEFVGDPKNLPVHDKLKSLGTALDELEQQGVVTNDDVAQTIEESFGQSRHLIRYPENIAGWERHALAFFRDPGNGRFPKFADVPELANLKSARLPAAVSAQLLKGQKAVELEQRYTKLETELSRYRYPE